VGKAIGKALRWGTKAAITAALFVLIFHPQTFGLKHGLVRVAPSALLDEVRAIDLGHFWPWILFAIAVKLAGVASSILRWNLLLKGQGIFLPFRHLITAFLTGRFFGVFLPGTLGLDGYRLFDTAKHTGKVVESTTVIAIEKLIGFIALTFLVFVTLPLGARHLQFKPVVLAAILVFLAGFVASTFLMLFHPRLIRLAIGLLPVPFRGRIEGKLRKISLAVTAYAGQRRLLLAALGWGVLVHVGTILMYFGTAMAIRARGVGITDLLFAAPLMIYGTVLGPSIGGEGIREVVMIALLGASTGSAAAFLFSHLGFWVDQIPALAGGVVYFLRPARYKPAMVLKDIEEVRARGRARAEVDREEADFQAELAAARETARAFLRVVPAAGLLAATLVGLGEAASIVATSPPTQDVQVLWYAVLFYAPIGSAVALGIAFAGSVVAALRRNRPVVERAFAWTFGGALVLLALPIVWFLVRRDLLHEQPLTLAQNGGVLAAHALLLAGVVLVAPRLLRLRPLARLIAPGAAALLFAVAVAGSAVAAKIMAPPPPAQKAGAGVPAALTDRPNVVLVMVDTLRADHVSAYGLRPGLTPNLDALAAEGTRFDYLIGQASWTKPAAASILTGLYPGSHCAIGKVDVLPPAVTTVAEAMRAGGYLTGAITDNINVSESFGFDQGFDEFAYLAPDYFFGARESSSRLLAWSMARLVRERFFARTKRVRYYYQDATVVNAAATAWVARHAGDRFFLFLHYMDPHDPYFAHPYDGRAVARVHTPRPDPARTGEIRALYEGEVRFWDEHFGALVADLKARGVYDSTLIAVTADHGEEFREHGGWWHGTTLYEEQVRVPLIVKWPKVGPRLPPVVPEVARQIDIAPTLLSSCGVAVPPAMQGRSLLAGPGDGLAYAEEDFEGNVLEMLRSPGMKLLTANPHNPRGLPTVELFDLAADAGETRNLADAPDRAAARADLDRRRAEVRELARGASVGGVTKSLAPEEIARLRALGYLTSGPAPTTACGGR
jgi:arylsulfatase A-like enzyme/uncharacterized membrane protein YbhN (UPF0104 family)